MREKQPSQTSIPHSRSKDWVQNAKFAPVNFIVSEIIEKILHLEKTIRQNDKEYESQTEVACEYACVSNSCDFRWQ